MGVPSEAATGAPESAVAGAGTPEPAAPGCGCGKRRPTMPPTPVPRAREALGPAGGAASRKREPGPGGARVHGCIKILTDVRANWDFTTFDAPFPQP